MFSTSQTLLDTGEHGTGPARQASGQSQEVNPAGREVLPQGRYRALCEHAAGAPNRGLRHQKSLPREGDVRLGPWEEWELVRHMGW